MRYPVVNIRPSMGGMLEDYQNEINNLKAKLYRGQAFQGFTPPPSTYGPTQPPAPPPPPPPPSQPSGTATYLGPRPGPMVATGEPKPQPPENPNDITVIRKPSPPPQYPGIDPYTIRPSVVTGIPPVPYDNYRPPTPTMPEPPPASYCPEGYTSTPSGCKKDVATDPGRPPMYPPPPPAPVGVAPSGINSGGYSWNSAPGATNPYPGVASTDCGPGKFWDGTQCRGSAGSMPTIPGGGSDGATAASGFNSGGGGYSSAMGFMGKVRMAGVRPESPFLPQVRLR